MVTIPEVEQDKTLPQKLKAEAPAILRWAVAGCLDWQRNGLQAPEDVNKATSTYRADMDTLGEFLEECCVIDPSAEARAGDIYKRYKAWADERGEYAETQSRFGTRLTERGFAKEKRRFVFYRSIRLLEQ
jgi:putative DNA primase/helicase